MSTKIKESKTMPNPNGRPMYYSQRMRQREIRMPDKLWSQAAEKATELTEKAGRKITVSDLIRKGLEKLLSEI